MNFTLRMQQRLRFATVVAAMFFAAHSVSAQVKIGTNPTAIDPANNLEVEASTAGRVTSVNKTTGQVTIADGTQGLGRIFTSNATGGGSWQVPGAQSTPVIIFERSTGSPFQVLPPAANNAMTKVNFISEVIDKSGNYDPATNAFTVPTGGGGYYQISGIFASQLQSHNQGAYFFIFVNGVNRRYLTLGNSNSGAGITAGGTAIVVLNPGDVVDIRVSTSTDDVNLTVAQLDIVFISK